MVDLYAQQRKQRIHERRRWAHDMREPGLRDELKHALWELRKVRRENKKAQRTVTIWQRQVEIMEHQVADMFMSSWEQTKKLANNRPHTTDLQTYALRRVVMVQRRELMDLREEKDRLAGILDQVRNADRWQAQDEWERRSADMETWDRLSDSALLDFDNSLRTLRIHDGVVIPDPEPDED